jgi:diguanylate cyclase (GGDEF)-like protein
MQLTTRTEGLAGVVRSSRTVAAGLAIVAIVALVAVFMLDRATGAAPVQHLYYVPIILAGLVFRMPGGVLAGVTAILMYHLANPHMLTFKYEESDLIQILLFLAVGITTARLTNDADRLRRLALTDDLTGLHNLRSFEEQLLGLVRASRASRTPLVLLVLDVDRLKMLNDRYGHLAGAEAVRTVGHIIGRQLPREAVGCRYGGDEFVVAVPRSSAFDGYRLADDLCHAVNACAPLLAGQQFPEGTLSISVGVVSASFEHGASSTDPLARDVESGEAAFRAADAALYRAKSRGRNQVCVA